MLDVAGEEVRIELTEERLRAANIHPATLLATDYLNHFNEVIMLLDLIPTMPDCLEDVIGWEPASYEEHFIRSQYRDKELVLAAFAEAPVGARRRFLALVDEMNAVMTDTIAQLGEHADSPMAGYIAEEAADRLKQLAARASGVMNGGAPDEEADGATAQDAIDALMTR